MKFEAVIGVLSRKISQSNEPLVVLNVAIGFFPATGAVLTALDASAVPPGAPPGNSMVTFFILIGSTGLSSTSRVLTFEMATAMAKDCLSTIAPKTGCFEDPPENQSRLALCATLRKNCEPPEFFWPVLAIESVPGMFEVLSVCSSLMLPPLNRFSCPPVFKLTNEVPSAGPPVPDRFDFGSFECGQPNWFMKPGITRWK
mmetsp:Transcript_4246/g.13303  ORF Transcript_4246/g.13303 Transcript_4246/m.13303 type:complete len:200 (+) Transcript_4246:298-897(+)